MYNAVILAGGKTPWLQKAVGTNIRALAPLGGRRMVEYIIDALDQSGQIGRIIVAADGSQWEAAVLPQRAELVAVESSSMPETAAAAAARRGSARCGFSDTASSGKASAQVGIRAQLVRDGAGRSVPGQHARLGREHGQPL